MSVYSDVRTNIRKGALAALAEFPTTPIIFSHSSGTEPAESYVVINILQIEQIGQAYTSTLAPITGTYGWSLGFGYSFSESDATPKLDIQANYNAYVQFSFIGSQSGEMSQSFKQRLNNVIIREEFIRNNLGIRSKTNIRRAPQKRDTKWVEYHNMDVVFTYAVNTQQDVDVVEAVVIVDEITGEVFTVPPDFIITP